VFYEVLRLCGGPVIDQPVRASGSAKERPSRAWGEGRGREGGGARFDECIEESGSGRHILSCSARF